MSKQPFAHLGATLDRHNYEWLLRENEELAVALETEVLNGAEPEEVGRFMSRHLCDQRPALVARCVSAARWLKSEQALERA